MYGNKYGFDYRGRDEIAELLMICRKRIAKSLEEYTFSKGSIVYVQITFRKLDVKLLTEFGLDKSSNDIITNRDAETITSTRNIPVSLNESSLDTPLKVDFVDILITYIYVTHNNETFNFLDRIKKQASFVPKYHKDVITSFDSSYKFHLLYINTDYYVLATKFIDNNKVIKRSYLLNGVLYTYITDTLLPNNIVSRLHGNTEFLLENGNVVYSKQALFIKPIPKLKVMHIAGEDSNIDVIDLKIMMIKLRFML